MSTMRDTRETIDVLRDLLRMHDRDNVSMATLEGIASVPNWPSGVMEYVRTGDRAIVFLGPEDKLDAVLRYQKGEDTCTFEITLPATAQMKALS